MSKNEMCTVSQLKEILRLCSKKNYYLLFFCFTKSMAQNFILYLNDTYKRKPRYFDLYFSNENLTYEIWNKYCEQYKFEIVNYTYEEELNNELDKINNVPEDEYFLLEEKIYLNLLKKHNIENPPFENYLFLRPIKCIDGAYGDDLDLFQPYYNLDYCIYCGSQYYANCPNIKQSGLEMCLIGRYTIKINGKDVEVFYCDDFGEDCLNLNNNTKDEYIDWFNNIINYKKIN